jgi:hypothetical protein
LRDAWAAYCERADQLIDGRPRDPPITLFIEP